MNKQMQQTHHQQRPKSSRLSRVFSSMRMFVLVGIISAGSVIGIVQQVWAAQTATEYCSQYTENSQKNACKEGINGIDCNDYLITHDQSHVDICNKSAKARAAGTVNTGTVTVPPTPTPSTSPTTGSSTGKNENQIQDQLDQTDSLSDFIDVLHQAGPDAETDTSEEPSNNYDSYTNGAGKQQEINVRLSGRQNSPAIVFFNGGGWHANDHTSDAVADNSPMKNGLPDGTHIGPITGRGAIERGYTIFDVTYRLGSDSVYYSFEDVMRGLRHVLTNAEMYGIDASKVAIWGDSAGASLAMRAAASGKSGAKAAVGWSSPTNGYTAIFKSYKSLLIGMDHSTCIPFDLAGAANTADLLNGGNGDVAEEGTGLASNDFSSLQGLIGGSGGTDAIGTLTEVLTAGQYALTTAQNVESISQQLESGGIEGLSGGIMNLSAKKFTECIDNFNALSPALFASPETPPTFLAGFDTDDLIDPQQSYDMRDKLHTLGIRSEALIIPGDPNAFNQPFGASDNHMGYDPRFVCPTLEFLDSIIQPDAGKTDCGTGVAENQGSTDTTASTGGGGSGNTSSGSSGGGTSSGSSSSSTSNGSSSGSSNNSGSTSSSQTIAQQKSACTSAGYVWKDLTKGGGYCNKPTQNEIASGYYAPSYESSGDSGRYTCPKGGKFTQNSKGNICKL